MARAAQERRRGQSDALARILPVPDAPHAAADGHDADAPDAPDAAGAHEAVAPRASALRSVLRWTVAVTALLLVGAVALGIGWTWLGGAERERRATTECVEAAAEAAEQFAEVLGDTREVDPRTLEPSCASRS